MKGIGLGKLCLMCLRFYFGFPYQLTIVPYQLQKQQTCNMSNENVLDLRDEHGNTVLHLAAARGNLDCIEYLCRRWQHLIQAENKAKLTPAASAIKVRLY